MDVREQGEEWCIATNTFNDSRHTQTFTESMKYLVDVSFWKLTWNITVVLAAVHNFFTGFYRFSSTFKVSKPNVSRLLTPLSSHLNCHSIPKAIIFQLLYSFWLCILLTIIWFFSARRQQTNMTVGSFHFKYSKLFGWYERLCRSNTRLCWKVIIFQALYSNLNMFLTLHGVRLKEKVFYFQESDENFNSTLLISCLKLF